MFGVAREESWVKMLFKCDNGLHISAHIIGHIAHRVEKRDIDIDDIGTLKKS